jgi:regulator of RNase E activity RraB
MDRNSKLLAHAKRNRELVRVFTDKHVDLDTPRSVELHFWAWGQSNSALLAQELYKRGFMLLLLKPAQLESDPQRWNIEAGTRSSISKVISDEFTGTLIDIASIFEAEYDGWGTAV